MEGGRKWDRKAKGGDIAEGACNASRRCRIEASLYSRNCDAIRLYAAVRPYCENVAVEEARFRGTPPARDGSVRANDVLMLRDAVAASVVVVWKEA